MRGGCRHMSRNLQIGLGSLRILDERSREIGQPGLTLWTAAGQTALQAHRQEMAEAAQAARQAQETLARVTARASKAEIFSMIEEANLALAGALERFALCFILGLLICASATSTGDT